MSAYMPAAFLAYFSFGANIADYKDYSVAVFSQFKMLFGQGG
jgi:hypothetical protein